LQTKILSKIGADKLLHLFAGGWIACLATNWYYALLIAFIVLFPVAFWCTLLFATPKNDNKPPILNGLFKISVRMKAAEPAL
jgi:hypothetical protein